MSKKFLSRIGGLTTLLLLIFSIGLVRAQDNSQLLFIFWDTGAEARPGWEALLQGFNESNPEIAVELRGIQGTNWTEYLNGVATLIAGGERPDVIWVGGYVQLLTEQGLIAPLDDLIERDIAELQEYIDDVPPAMFEALQVDGVQYMIPYSWNNMVMYYNTARFEEAGLDAPAEDWTRDDFLAAAQTLTEDADGDGTPERYGYAFTNGDLFTGIMPWVFANDGNIVTEDYCAPTFNSPEVIEALQFMYDLIYEYKVAPAPATSVDLFNLFKNGDIAMFGAGRWPLTNFIPTNFSDFNVQYWPGNPETVTEFGADGFAIFNASDNQDTAWTLLKYFAQPAVSDALVGSTEAPLSNIPVRRSSAELMSGFPPENSGIFFESLERRTRYVPVPSRFTELESIVVRYTSSVFASELTVEEAVEAGQQELMSVVSCE